MKLDTVRLLPHDAIQDERGYTYTMPIPEIAVAQFVSVSHANVLRGLHYQDARAPQGKLIRCTRGEILDVVVDLRESSPKFGHTVSHVLGADASSAIWVPPGYAHGIYAFEDNTVVEYILTGHAYASWAGHVLLWNDPALGIVWPTADPILSARDAKGKKLVDARIYP
jgi:dTDP-4-dehydrorhamnose 3,5-epimerase